MGRTFRCSEDNKFYFGAQHLVEKVFSVYDCYKECVDRPPCNTWAVPKKFPVEGADCRLSAYFLYYRADDDYFSGAFVRKSGGALACK